jgi:hypothetical protein
MSKTQVITIEKEDSAWANVDECLLELSLAINSTGIPNTLKYEMPAVGGALTNQTYTESRTWNDEEYTAYKKALSSYETAISEALSALGWIITDTVTNA